MSLRPTYRYPRVALVGRTNVGKSTLYNRLTETRQALVSQEAHTTRDRKFGLVSWQGSAFEVVDTGGMDTEDNEIGRGIMEQAQHAIREADLILFTIDVRDGILPQDRELATLIRQAKRPCLLVANKADNFRLMPQAYESDMFQLRLGTPIPISAATGLGVGDLLDEVLIQLDQAGHPAVPRQESEPLRITLVGRPNVGKSSLVNSILGEPRAIVSPLPHTTREPQDTAFIYKEQEIVLVDTAGMRKRAHIEKGVEEDGISLNERALARCNVALLVFDASEDPTVQDRKLAGMLEDTRSGLILVANKWDVVQDKTSATATEYERLIRQSFPFLDWAPLIFVSAKTGLRAGQLLDKALEVQAERNRHIDYNALNRLLKTCIKAMRPLAEYGLKSPRIYDVAQVGHAPPTFIISVIGEKENIHRNWVKFFEKRLRQKFGFIGTPIVVQARNIPPAKAGSKRNRLGAGMEAVAGPIREKKPLVNQTRRRQKHQ